MSDAHDVERLVDASYDFRTRPAHLKRPECNLVENGRVEELYVGILEDECDPAAKRNCETGVTEALSGVSDSPQKSIEPEDGKQRASSRRSKVDLPEPFAPTSATDCPPAMESERPSSAAMFS